MFSTPCYPAGSCSINHGPDEANEAFALLVDGLGGVLWLLH